MENIIKERLNKKSSMGFGADLNDKYDKVPNIMDKVTIEDLREFGMIPEFIGRLPIIFTLQGLTKDMLIRDIERSRKMLFLKQYQKLLSLDEVDLRV